MSITLELPPELESELSDEATRLKLPVSEYALRILANRPLLTEAVRTGTELVAYWQNEKLIGTRPDITDSQAHARQLRNEAERREKL